MCATNGIWMPAVCGLCVGLIVAACDETGRRVKQPLHYVNSRNPDSPCRVRAESVCGLSRSGRVSASRRAPVHMSNHPRCDVGQIAYVYNNLIARRIGWG